MYIHLCLYVYLCRLFDYLKNTQPSDEEVTSEGFLDILKKFIKSKPVQVSWLPSFSDNVVSSEQSFSSTYSLKNFESNSCYNIFHILKELETIWTTPSPSLLACEKLIDTLSKCMDYNDKNVTYVTEFMRYVLLTFKWLRPEGSSALFLTNINLMRYSPSVRVKARVLMLCAL